MLVGLSVHVAAVLGYYFYPEYFYKIQEKVETKLVALTGGFPSIANRSTPQISVDPIAANFTPWVAAQDPNSASPGEIKIGAKRYKTVPEAVAALQDGGLLEIGEGTYRTAFVVKTNNVHIKGNGRVLLEGAAIGGKAAIITQGNNIRISNIECKSISVSDGNGACVRHEGIGLELDHVYFHQSEQGLLSGNKGKLDQVTISNSRFEKLGNGGRAHGVYVNGGHLTISDSLFLSARSQGHEIKSRAINTRIQRSVVASLGGVDSRLIDIPNGGRLTIVDSVLEQGPNSSNMDMIGYGLEGSLQEENTIILQGNTILLERNNGNQLLHISEGVPAAITKNNIIISDSKISLKGANYFFEDRDEAGIKAYPYLPPVPK